MSKCDRKGPIVTLSVVSEGRSDTGSFTRLNQPFSRYPRRSLATFRTPFLDVRGEPDVTVLTNQELQGEVFRPSFRTRWYMCLSCLGISLDLPRLRWRTFLVRRDTSVGPELTVREPKMDGRGRGSPTRRTRLRLVWYRVSQSRTRSKYS